MFRKCCVCKTSRQDAILHRFPSNEIRLKEWLKCVNRDDLKNLPSKKLINLFVCHLHFEKKFISSSGSHLLNKAYPSLFTEEEISSGVPSQGNTENVDPICEHSYARKTHFDHTYSRREPLRDSIGVSDLRNKPGTSQNPYVTSAYCTEAVTQISSDLESVSGTSHLSVNNTLVNSALNQIEKARHVMVPKARKRIIHKIKDLTPTAKCIYQEYQRAKRQKDFYKRAKRALAFTKEQLFEKLTNDMNPYARKIMNMQIKLCNKNKKGRRFTNEEKLLALCIMKQSPKGYKFLHNIFILPSRSTLNNMVSKFNIQTGICPQLFKLMKEKMGLCK
ncbi:uncharacterized protein LOC121725635 isoform X2 [Aricia agestis]|uniref:uncharacterized protein LOC121725635 isoform X2 n=1 Tax=Aricia agestis TaxID=91739 RepID=UPI001C20983E|nr:uncharacterized protein LOC121725635 isoform X2 [Aricia agestis]